MNLAASFEGQWQREFIKEVQSVKFAVQLLFLKAAVRFGLDQNEMILGRDDEIDIFLIALDELAFFVL